MLGYSGVCALWIPLLAWMMPNDSFKVRRSGSACLGPGCGDDDPPAGVQTWLGMSLAGPPSTLAPLPTLQPWTPSSHGRWAWCT